MKKTLITALAIIALSLFSYSTIKWSLWKDNQDLYTKDISTDLSASEVAKIQEKYPNYQFNNPKGYCKIKSSQYTVNRGKFLCYEEIEISSITRQIVTKP